MSRRIAVTGAAGLMGSAVVSVARARGYEVAALTRQEMDITDFAAVSRVLGELKPDWVVHSAALPDPDYCEQHPVTAWSVNAGGTEAVALASAAVGAKLCHISTDSVFDGVLQRLYVENDKTNPINVYARTKLAAELAAAGALVVRISVLVGPSGPKGSDSISKAIEKARRGERIRAASDQMSTVTSTLDASDALLRALEAGCSGPLHVASEGLCSRYELIRAGLEAAGLDPELVEAVPMTELKRPARRPAYSALATSRLAGLGIPVRDWREVVQRPANL